MAGDSDLSTRGASQPAPEERSGHDPDELAVWLAWFARARWVVPLGLFPGWYAVHRVLGMPFHARSIWTVVLVSWLVNGGAVGLISIYRKDVTRHARNLERLASAQTVVDIALMVIAVHEAGGAMGPFWPFPALPVIIGAALLPNLRAVVFHALFATAATAVSAWSHGPSEVIAPVVLSAMFASTGGLLAYWLARGLKHQRALHRNLERLLTDKELAEAVARRREEILAVVSHELASPLMTLRGYVHLLKESKGRDRGPQQLLERVERQVDRLSSLADDLLQMASTTAGALRLHRVGFDLMMALREMKEGLRVQFPDANIVLGGDASVPGVWDRDRLEQLFGNLVSNAVKFAGARCSLEIDVRLEGSREVHVRVTDDGPGISKEALKRIFEPFQRYSSERGGLGLGLAIAQAVVELHEGRIWAESPSREGGRGSTFHVVLPTDSKPSGTHPAVAGPPSDSNPTHDAPTYEGP